MQIAWELESDFELWNNTKIILMMNHPTQHRMTSLTALHNKFFSLLEVLTLFNFICRRPLKCVVTMTTRETVNNSYSRFAAFFVENFPEITMVSFWAHFIQNFQVNILIRISLINQIWNLTPYPQTVSSITISKNNLKTI